MGVILLYNADDLVKVLKQAAVDAVNATKPTDITFGKVISTSPLKIQVEQKLILSSAQLILARNVTDYEVDVTVGWNTGNYSHTHTITDTYMGGGSASTDTHNHNVTGTKKMTIHNALSVGEMVIMMQMSGGQKYIVIDRI